MSSPFTSFTKAQKLEKRNAIKIKKLFCTKREKKDGMEVLFQFYLWDQSHVTIVWNTRETGDIDAWKAW